MYQLSEEEVSTIEAWLSNQQLHNKTLGLQLLDHICCATEEQMDNAVPLDAAFKRACETVCPNGMLEIEEETFFLLTYNKQTNMKRILFSTGFVSTFLISFGSLFKLLHWPMANVLLLTGFGFLLLTLFVMIVYTSGILRSLTTPMRVRMITGLVSGIMIVTGIIFKMLYYPGASVLILTGSVLLNIVFLPLFFYQLYRKSLA